MNSILLPRYPVQPLICTGMIKTHKSDTRELAIAKKQIHRAIRNIAMGNELIQLLARFHE